MQGSAQSSQTGGKFSSIQGEGFVRYKFGFSYMLYTFFSSAHNSEI